MKGKFIVYALLVSLVSTILSWSEVASGGGSRTGSGSSWSSNSGGGSWGGGGGHK
jgi:uncharacterized membrane protein YgcG